MRPFKKRVRINSALSDLCRCLTPSQNSFEISSKSLGLCAVSHLTDHTQNSLKSVDSDQNFENLNAASTHAGPTYNSNTIISTQNSTNLNVGTTRSDPNSNRATDARNSSNSLFTVNLSDYKLSTADTKLLDRGLKYIPTYRFQPTLRIYETQSRLLRNLKLKDYFSYKQQQQNNFDYKRKTFKEPSTWTPADHKVSSNTLETVHDVVTSTERLIKNCKIDRGLITLRNQTNNLPAAERAALKNLIKNDKIIIKPADKGSATVIMNKTDYIAEAHRQLYNEKYYRRLDGPIFEQNVPKINTVLENLLFYGYIDNDQLSYLRARETDRGRIFYLLPKIHKPLAKWPNLGKMPEGRPIVSDCNSESYRVCEYIDSFLQPLSIKNDACIKDTYDFVSKVRGQKIPKNAILVTADVTALYTNMDLNRTLEVVKETFQNNPDPKRPDEFLLKLLEITLKNNDFQFGDEHFVQILGTAMGKRYAPSLANLYLKYFDEKAKDGIFGIKPLLYFRFIDDVHFAWTGTEKQLKQFETYLNTLIPGIKITFEYSTESVHFLDTTLYKKPETNYDVIQTKVYFKETDTHQLLHKMSFHPKHTSRGVLKSQLLRFKRISSCYEDYSKACGILFKALIQRQYSRSLLRSMKRSIWKSENLKNTQLNGELLPVIVPFNEIGIKLAKNWRDLISKNEKFKDFRLITAYSNGPNLHQKLIRSDLKTVGANSAHKNTKNDPTQNQNITLRCANTKCKACNYLTEGKYFKSTKNLQKFTIRGRLTCKSANVIYLITCKNCRKQYVGETGRSIKDRINDHLSAIRLKKPTPVGSHFNLCGHKISDFTLMPIEQLQLSKNTKSDRLTMEITWQNLLQSTYPNGINQVPKKLTENV